MARGERRAAESAVGTADPGARKGEGGLTLDRAFAELRAPMFALAYRITGNRADAEEIVQDAFMRLHGADSKVAVRSLKAYLVTITARLSLNRLRDQRARRETYVGEWLPEPLPTDDGPVATAQDVSFALLTVLQRLSPLERVVFVLRNAFDFGFEEIAPVVGRNSAACRKIFSRARERMRKERPRFPVDRERHRALLRSFMEATRGGDTAKLVSLLDEDAVLRSDGGGKALATKKPVVGGAAIARFLVAVARKLPADVRVMESLLNGSPGLVFASGARAILAVLIETDGARIHSVFAVANPEKLGAVSSAL